MNDLPIKKLTALTKHFGKDLLDDFGRCDELLADFCGEYRLEVNLLISALREGCSKVMLEGTSDGVVANEVHIRLVSHLQHNAGILAEYAEWAVKAIAATLELQIADPMNNILPEPKLSVNSGMAIPHPVMQDVFKPPVSIPKEHYENVCSILLKSGNNWKEPSVWAKIDNDVKRLCVKARLGEHEIRNWMRFAWPGLEKQYEAKQQKELQEAIAAERKLQEDKKTKGLEAERHNNQVKLLTDWLENLPDAKWDYDQWDFFISSLDQTANLKDLEICRDNAIINYDNYSVKDLQTGLIWHKGIDVMKSAIHSSAAKGMVAKLRSDNFSGYATWRLPSDSELEIFSKRAPLFGLPEYSKRCILRRIDKINIIEKEKTIIDCTENVEWFKNEVGHLFENTSLKGAIELVREMSDNAYLGYNNWRLPTRTEFEQLLEYYAIEYLTGLNASDFWTSQEYDHEFQYVVTVTKPQSKLHYATSIIENAFKTRSKAVYSRVWPVRSIR